MQNTHIHDNTRGAGPILTGRYMTRSIPYDILLSILYASSVFQAYSYDAKTRTTGILMYALVYGVFTLLIRSPLGAVMMNVLSAITLPWIFTAPVMQQAGGYFDFQPYIGIGATILIGIIQGVLSVMLMVWGQKLLKHKYQFTVSAVIAIVFTIVLTVVVSM